MRGNELLRDAVKKECSRKIEKAEKGKNA